VLGYRGVGADASTPVAPSGGQEAVLTTQAEVPVFTTCPHCSYLQDGTCVVCADSDAHPGCTDCVGGQYLPPKPPWWKSQFVSSLAISVTATVISMVLVVKIQQYLSGKKAK
jgi:hypothetical protein